MTGLLTALMESETKESLASMVIDLRREKSQLGPVERAARIVAVDVAALIVTLKSTGGVPRCFSLKSLPALVEALGPERVS